MGAGSALVTRSPDQIPAAEENATEAQESSDEEETVGGEPHDLRSARKRRHKRIGAQIEAAEIPDAGNGEHHLPRHFRRLRWQHV